MDFKQRFAGKMTKINKVGGIDDMVASSHKPIQMSGEKTQSSYYNDRSSQGGNINQQAPSTLYGANTSGMP